MSTRDRIAAELESWPGVESGPGRFDSLRFVIGRRELGHLHGDQIADLPLRPETAQELIAAGKAREHRFTREGSGWVTVELRSDDDADRVIELMRTSYERAVEKRPELAG